MVAVGVKPLKPVSQLHDIVKEKTRYVCALHFHVNTVHIAGLISPHFKEGKEKKRKKRVLVASAHFENLCPFFFKILPHVMASPAYVRIVFIESFTVVKNKPDIQRKCFKIRVPKKKKKVNDFWNTENHRGKIFQLNEKIYK